MTRCRVCGVGFSEQTDSIVICKYHGGNVHLGCCLDCCSWDKKPCSNALGVFEKI